jgi:very-short-patch-repair endonuclease
MITRRNSTKSERKFYELLKYNHVPFKYKQKIGGREVDFIIGKYAIEIDGHEQDGLKNEMLAKEGYVPIHLSNKNIKTITKKWLNLIYPQSSRTESKLDKFD